MKFAVAHVATAEQASGIYDMKDTGEYSFERC